MPPEPLPEETMSKRIALAATLLAVLCAPAQSATVPSLSGSYLYAGTEFCPSGTGTNHQTTGTALFDPETGKAKLDIYIVTGDKPTMLHVKSTEAYSNTSSTFKLGADSYKISYGAVQNGIATQAAFIGLVQDGETICGFQGSITLQ